MGPSNVLYSQHDPFQIHNLTYRLQRFTTFLPLLKKLITPMSYSSVNPLTWQSSDLLLQPPF